MMISILWCVAAVGTVGGLVSVVLLAENGVARVEMIEPRQG